MINLTRGSRRSLAVGSDCGGPARRYRAAFFGGFDTMKSTLLALGFGGAVWQSFIVAQALSPPFTRTHTHARAHPSHTARVEPGNPPRRPGPRVVCSPPLPSRRGRRLGGWPGGCSLPAGGRQRDREGRPAPHARDGPFRARGVPGICGSTPPPVRTHAPQLNALLYSASL